MKQSYIILILVVIVAVVGIGYWMMNSGNEPIENQPMKNPPQEIVKDEPKVNKPKSDYGAKNIVQVATDTGSFTTLVAAVKAAGLAETLSGPGPFTVLAPSDEAFAKLPEGTVESLLKDKEKLTKILTYHVIPGKVMAEDVVKLTSAKTVQGQEVMIKVAGGKVMINEANVVTTDIEASNGVIHVIDSVIMPK